VIEPNRQTAPESLAGFQRLDNPSHAQHGARHNAGVIARIHECQRWNAEVEQVLPVYAREALGDDDLEAQIARCDGCVLTTGTLAIIVARNDFDVLEYMRR
jgi:hypothetical protein